MSETMFCPQVLSEVQKKLAVPTMLLREIADSFQRAMLAGLEGRESSLKMLPSYLGHPAGGEQGEFIAIDFGGSNVRVLRVELNGRGLIGVQDRRAFCLKDPDGVYDYTSPRTTAFQLFDFIAGKIAELVIPGRDYSLGITFSFPCKQDSLKRAVLLSWTKEIRVADVEGRDIGELLQAALQDRFLDGVYPRVIINDTVGTLLASAYADADADIASICGTGHNTCYLEPKHPLTGKPMIVNIESGNFAGFPLTEYDRELDKGAEKPGTQLLEKTAAGRYLGELTRLVIRHMIDAREWPLLGAGLNHPYSLRGEDMSVLLADVSPELSQVAAVVKERWSLELSLADLRTVRLVTELILKRSARLVTATFLGVLARIDHGLERNHTIAVDGSLYEKMPGYAAEINNALTEVLGEAAARVKVRLTKDGSGTGAAIAAAIADQG